MQRDFITEQRDRYDAEAELHDKIYHHPACQKYRTEFIRDKLLIENLNEKKSLDAMCASGIETGYLLDRGAEVMGLDISPNNAQHYRERWQRECLVESIHRTGLPDNEFDVVYIAGGLHHILPELEQTVREIHRILKPGGMFYFVEPNSDTWLNSLRRVWYRNSGRFTADEAAISYRRTLQPFLAIGFQEQRMITGGNIAYIFVAQALHFPLLHSRLNLIYRPLALLERMAGWFPFTPRLFMAAAWKKDTHAPGKPAGAPA